MPADEAALADYFTFTDFRHFIEVYLSVVDLIRDPEDIRTLTYEVARDLAAPERALRRADPDAVLVDRAGHSRRGVLRGGRGRPAAGRAATSALQLALVLRHPRRGRRAVGRRHPGRRADPAAGRPGQLRPRRPRDRRRPRAVRRALRRGPRRRAAQRAARGRVDRAGDDLGRDQLLGRRAHRARHRRGRRPAADDVPGRAQHRARGLPDVQRLHAVGGEHRAEHPLPATGRRRRAGVDQLRRSADVLDDARTGVRGRRRAARTWTNPAWPTWPGPPCGSPSWIPPESGH